MPKHSGDAEPNQGDSKRSRSLASLAALASLESPELADAIETSDLRGCKKAVAMLESLLGQAKSRVSRLERERKKHGFAYGGDDAVKCDCGNTLDPEGDYAITCECSVVSCTECCKPCPNCEAEVCKKCGTKCTHCEEMFCGSCLEECCQCHEKLCGRDGDCETITVGYGGESSCKYCLER